MSNNATLDTNPEDEETTNSTTRLVVNLMSPYFAVRQQAVSNSVNFFGQAGDDAEAKPGQYRRVGRALMTSFVECHYSEKTYRAELLQAIGAALSAKNMPFDFKAFIGDYLVESKSRFSLAYSRMSGIQLSLFLLGVHQGNDDAALPVWVCQSVQVIGELLESLAAESSRKSGKLLAKCVGQIGSYFKQNRQMLLYAINTWAESSYICSLAQIYISLSTLKTPTPSAMPSKRAKPSVAAPFDGVLSILGKALTDVMSKKVLNSKVPLTPSIMSQLGLYLKALNTEQWADGAESPADDAAAAANAESGGLEAATLRTLKKSPEGSSPVISSILTYITVDLSNFVKNGAAVTALRIMKSPTADVRANGSSIMRSIATKCSDPSAFEVIVRVLVEALQGKGALALVQPYQRLGVLLALSDCSDSQQMTMMGKSFISELALTAIIPVLMAVMDKETDENNLLVAANTLGKWMGLTVTIAKHQTALDSIKTGLTRSKLHSVGYLAALTLALNQNYELSSDLLVFVSALSNIVKEGAKKPSNQSQVDAILAFRLLLQMSVSSSVAVASIDTGKLWACLAPSATSFLYSKALMQQVGLAPVQSSSINKGAKRELYSDLPRGIRNLNSLVAESVSSIIFLVSLHHPNHLVHAATSGDSDGPVSSALSCLLHPDPAVRSAVTKQVREVFSSSTAADDKPSSQYPTAVKMLKALNSCLATWSDQMESAAAGSVTASSASAGANEEDATGQSNASMLRGQLGIPPSSRLTEALLVIISHWQATKGSKGVADMPTAQVMSIMLLACSHPLVCESRVRASVIWCNVTSSFKTAETGRGVLDTDEARVIACKRILSAALCPTAQLTRQAAHTALYVLSTATGPSGKLCVLRHILPSLRDQLVSSGVTAVSDDDVDKFMNPLAAIAAATAAVAETADADIRITNADRKKDSGRSRRTGAFGGDFVEDEDWAEKIKKEKAQKLAITKNAGQVGSNAKLKDLQELQSRVQIIVDTASYALEAFLSLTTFSVPHARFTSEVAAGKSCDDVMLRGVVRSSVSQMLPVLLPMLRCPLVEKTAFQCVLGISGAIEDELTVVASRDLADSLRITATVSMRPVSRKVTRDGLYKELLGLGAPLQRLLRSVQIHLSRQQARKSPTQHLLLTSTLHLLFPVLQGLLTQPSLLPGCDFTFMILDSIWPKPSNESSSLTEQSPDDASCPSSLICLQKAVTETCLSVLVHLRVDPPPDTVLLRIITQYFSFHPTDATNQLDWISPLMDDLGLLSADLNVQMACLRAIEGALSCSSSSDHAKAQVAALSKDSVFETRLWLAKFNANEAVCTLATAVWESRGCKLSSGYRTALVPLLSFQGSVGVDRSEEGLSGAHVRLAAARALSGGMLELPDSSAACVAEMKALYHSSKPVPAASTGRILNAGNMLVGKGKDSKGPMALSAAPVAVPMSDPHISTRLAVAEFIRAAGAEGSLPLGEKEGEGESHSALDLLDFVLAYGAVDYSGEVRSAMLTAGRALADIYGSTMCRPMLSLLEAVLLKKSASKSVEDLAAHDHRHSAAVVLMGAAGRHLSADDPSVVGITESMVTALQTPSEGVQKAVADCLVQLVQVMKSSAANGEKAKEMLERLMLSVLEEETYGRRRGAAYGIGAFVKGLGIPSLKAHDVVPRLREACTNGGVNAKQGALFAIECLSERLGLLFEPYVITIVPILLKSFSHASDHVREAAQGAAKVIMGRLSAHGVKQVLTPILTSLPEETQWKSRQEAIKLLGYMAHCAPKQLAACLPQIVPRLVEAGSDPHPKVKEGARAAMLDISSVIRNPEISRLAPVLLSAMADPANKTKDALEALLECEFMHSIDAPSLALLVPILGRALRDRGADLKRKASAITGNMVSMVSEPKTLVPYLVQVLPGLKDCLLDPIPDVRATSAKALGSLVGGVGESELPELVPWLMETLKSEASPVERSGAAQGLAEVCLALGADRLDEILDTALALRNQPRCAAREGLLWLLSFLPSVLQESFSMHIKTTLPVILLGLSDESEGVREVALRSGQVMVTVLGNKNALLLLPSLTGGMFDDDWRIRHSSLILLGDLLYLLGGTKAVGMADGEEEDEDLAGVSTGYHVTITLRAHLGIDSANEVLAALYIVRSDVSMAVRQSALQVWKSVVSNTPRTLVEIIPILIEQLISKLSAESAELRVVAGKSLGELVRKMGDRVLPVVVPHLRKQLKASRNSEGDDALRQGVCLGLTEILASATRRQVEDYIDSLMPALQEALCDRSEEVRSQAAKAFQTLFKNIGPRAVDDILPALLARMGVIVGDDNSDDEDEDEYDDEEEEEDKEGDDEDGSGDDDEDDNSDDDDLEEEEDEESMALVLLGLQGVVQLRPRDLLEYLLDPSCLLRHPMQAAAAKTLAGVVSVSGAQLNYHFSALIPALCMELFSAAEIVDRLEATAAAFLSGEGVETEDVTEELAVEKERLSIIKECAGSVMGAVTTTGVNFLSSELGRQIEHDTDVRRRRWGCWLLEQFVRRSKAVFSDYLPVLFKYLLSRVAEFDRQLLQAVSDALLAISISVPAEELSLHLDFVRSCVNSTASDARHRVGAGDLFNSVTGAFTLPLLTIPKSLEPFLTIALHGLMNGSLQAKETAADVIAELAAMADPAVLKPYLIKTTGPLIRVVGDRFPSNVKAAILQTLAVLLDKGGGSLKAFAPQLQTTFIKSLSDPSKLVRQRGSIALGKLMALNARVDPLLAELATCVTQAEGPAIRASTLEALSVVLSKGGGEKASPASIEKVQVACLSALVEGDEESVRVAAAACLSSLTTYMDTATISNMLIDLSGGSAEVGALCGRLLGAGSVLQSAGQRATDSREEAYSFLRKGLKDERAAVKTCACSALISMFTAPPPQGDTAAGAVDSRKGEYRTAAQGALHSFSQLVSAAAADSSSVEVRKAAMSAIKQAAKSYPIASQLHMQHFMPPLILAVKDSNIRLKYIAERAMKYLLDGGENATVIATYTAGADIESARFVKEYARRSLSRLPADSDDESNDKW